MKLWLGIVIGSVLTACSAPSSVTSSSDAAIEDNSASGAAASAVGQSLGGSSSSGTVAYLNHFWRNILWDEAYADNSCPTVSTMAGAGCTANGGAADLTYASCNFGASKATWSGTLEVSLSSGSVTCGTFPNTAALANNVSLQRQFVTGGAPGTATRTSKFGTVITVDHASANLSNYDTQTIATTIGSGYGNQVTFDGAGNRKAVVIRQRVSTTKYDHSIAGAATISESSGLRTVSGTLTVYHNLMRVTGTATFNNVVYDDSCATPVSGSISTVFAAGQNVTPTTRGAALVGTTETLAFSGCGAQILTQNGTRTAVALSGI